MQLVVGREGQLTTVCFTPPSAAHLCFTCFFYAGKANPPSAVHSARSRLRLPPARRPLPLCGQARRAAIICQASRLWYPQTAAAVLTSQPAVAVFDQTVTTVFLTVCVCLAPEGSWYPWASPRKFWGGCRAPAEETEVGAGAAVSEAVPPWPPELPAPPWPPELPAPPWLRAPCSAMASRAPCSTWTSVCLFHFWRPRPVYVSVSVLWGLQSAPPPLPGSTVTARDVPSGRGELC